MLEQKQTGKFEIIQLNRNNYEPRSFREDMTAAQKILIANKQFHDSVADSVFPYAGKELEFYSEERSIGYLAKKRDEVVGFIRGSCDGNRGLIQQLSVHPEFQNQGIGKELVKTFAGKLRMSYGLNSVGVVSAAGDELSSVDYYRKLGFREIPAKLMVHLDVVSLIE